MMVTFVAQCEKKSLNKTRRVLDSFANRIGSRTWQTVITLEGLKAVKKLLRKTASKNTAVSCHWLRSRSRSELVWIVGNRSKFNHEGYVPVNYTENEISQYMDNYIWKTIPVIQSVVAIAALFHDFGKATVLFQQKIDPKQKTVGFEPYRHEWISLRLFQNFVGDKSDEEWLVALSQVEQNQAVDCFRDGVDGRVDRDNHPIQKLSPFARFVAWLILTHHKLPLYPKWKKSENNPPKFESVSEWMGEFTAIWNSNNCKDPDQQDRVEQNWELGQIPYKSMYWRSKACLLASEVMEELRLKQYQDTNWIKSQLFTAHISRLCLMLADHYYSAQKKVTQKWRSPNYSVWANTYKKELHQQLDEHLLGVAHHAQKIARALPKLNSSLDVLKEKEVLQKNVGKQYIKKFGWQDMARRVSEKLAKATVMHGFFGVNMASTGKGKTQANAKIMYAVGSGTGRKRFSVALGLRTLTLQTGREYREKIGLNDEELAIVVGGTSVTQLFENEQSKQQDSNKIYNERERLGSESQDALLDPDLTVDYKGGITQHGLSEWTVQEKGLDKLLHAPVLVCTIDHLIPATEGTKGGRQIAAMLRLLTSDLILDEPDDFGLEDLPALCRLVHWAGMLGSRILLSTATMPPALSYALFLAYRDGWKNFASANIPDWNGEISCAWFDEFGSRDSAYSDIKQFKSAHESFVKKRVKKLTINVEIKRKGAIIPITRSGAEIISSCMAKTIQQNMMELHRDHQQSHTDKNISIGLIRMANIDPLVAVTRELLSMAITGSNTAIHYCVYHSRYPLAIRSYIENKLDRILTRKDPENIWQHPEIMEKLKNSPVKNHIFVVIASPVAEVGRDHDYDWAIVEPSSMRSIIQLAGRVLRHRPIFPTKPNILLLNKNYKALTGEQRCFVKPGFEVPELELKKMVSHDLLEILPPEQYEIITAIPRIVGIEENKLKDTTWTNLVELEHKALTRQLFTGKKRANVWWKNHPQWCGEVQRQQRFRQSSPDEPYYLFFADEHSPAGWQWKNEHVYPPKFGDLSGIAIEDISLGEYGKGNDFWFELDEKVIYSQLAEELKIDSLAEVSRRFGELRIVEFENTYQEYKYNPNLGVFRERGEGQ